MSFSVQSRVVYMMLLCNSKKAELQLGWLPTSFFCVQGSMYTSFPPLQSYGIISAGWLSFHIFTPQTRNPMVYVLLVQLFLNGMRIHVTNCFLFSQRELMLLHAKAQEFAMEVQCCNWHPAECQLCIWIPMFVTQQKEPECISIYSNTTLIFKYFHDKQDS